MINKSWLKSVFLLISLHTHTNSITMFCTVGPFKAGSVTSVVTFPVAFVMTRCLLSFFLFWCYIEMKFLLKRPQKASKKTFSESKFHSFQLSFVGPLFLLFKKFAIPASFRPFSKKHYNKSMWKFNPVDGAGIRTHHLQHVSLLR